MSYGGWRVGVVFRVVHFASFFNKIQIPPPRDKIIDQIPHPGASEGGQMSFKPWSRTIKISTLGTSSTIKIPTQETDLMINDHIPAVSPTPLLPRA